MTNKINPVVAAVTGAVIGAGVAVAGAVVLGNEKNRNKIKKVLTNAKNNAVDYMEGVQKGAIEKKDEVETKAKNVASSVNKSFHDAVKDAKLAANKK